MSLKYSSKGRDTQRSKGLKRDSNNNNNNNNIYLTAIGL